MQVLKVYSPDLVYQSYQNYFLDNARNQASIGASAEGNAVITKPYSPYLSLSASSSIGDLEHFIQPLFKFEEYIIIERDGPASFPDAGVCRSNIGRQFLSIFDGGCVSPDLLNPHSIMDDPAAAAARDPFYADWPYWDRAT